MTYEEYKAIHKLPVAEAKKRSTKEKMIWF